MTHIRRRDREPGDPGSPLPPALASTGILSVTVQGTPEPDPLTSRARWPCWRIAASSAWTAIPIR